MTTLLLVVIWYMIGVAGCGIAVRSDLNRGIDFKLSDLLVCILVSSLGIVMFIIGICEHSKYSEYISPTLIKGKK